MQRSPSSCWFLQILPDTSLNIILKKVVEKCKHNQLRHHIHPNSTVSDGWGEALTVFLILSRDYMCVEYQRMFYSNCCGMLRVAVFHLWMVRMKVLNPTSNSYTYSPGYKYKSVIIFNCLAHHLMMLPDKWSSLSKKTHVLIQLYFLNVSTWMINLSG